MLGHVRTMKTNKGFGFVVDADGREYFFHRSGFIGHWNDLCNDFDSGDKIAVSFEEDKPGDKGPRARNVRRLDHPNQAA